MDQPYDVTIVGAGPAGLFGAYYAGFRGLRIKIVDSQPDLGGQVTALYPDKHIYDVPGFPRILGKDLVANLVEQAMQYHPAVVLNEELRTLERLSGRGLHYAVQRKEEFRDRRVLVVGGGDSALDWALDLLPVARQITLIHRRDGFRAHARSVQQVLDSPITVKLFYELRALRGEPEVSEAIIVHTTTGREEVLTVDAVLAFLGMSSRLGTLATWGLALEGEAITANTHMETNLPGVYAADDIAAYPGKLKLIATGFGEVATAVNNAARRINPEAAVFPGHSTAVAEKKARTKGAGPPS